MCLDYSACAFVCGRDIGHAAHACNFVGVVLRPIRFVLLTGGMRLRWKLVFCALLALGLGLLWQNAHARRELFRELRVLRDFVNAAADGYEAWQVCCVRKCFLCSKEGLADFYNFLCGTSYFSQPGPPITIVQCSFD